MTSTLQRPIGSESSPAMMVNRIVLLDDTTANRIAAGEVIERPSGAVKELVENAIDAGATRILVRLEEGGRRRIEVVDDGAGMSSDEAVLAIHRHATSKLRTADDLESVSTLGFRGEALPSIGSVSRMTIITCLPGAGEGTELVVVFGELTSVGPAGARPGTRIIVEDLFARTPARLKFLKGAVAEASRSVEAVQNLALAHPEVAITVEEHGRVRLSTPGSGSLADALTAVWGRDAARELHAIRRTEPRMTVEGFLAPAHRSRPGRTHELFFLNGRPIKSRILTHALEEAVRTLTPEGRYPMAAIAITLDPSMVDVNVHPTKAEVRFSHDGSIHHAVYSAIRDTLLEHGVLPTLSPTEIAVSSPNTPVLSWPELRDPSPMVSIADFLPPLSNIGFGLGARVASADELPRSDGRQFSELTHENEVRELQEQYIANSPGSHLIDALATVSPEAQTETRPFAEQLRNYRVIGQFERTYILASTDHGLAIIDQHVAHERVLYERLSKSRRAEGVPVQHLAEPLHLCITPAEAALVQTRIADFIAAGWQMEPFGGDSFLVRTAPVYAKRKGHIQLLRDIVDELAYQSVSRRLIVQSEHVTITNACKLAVKAGDPLSIPEMEALLSQLADTDNPYLCPHGRPIVVTVALHEIEKKFKRA